MVHASVAFARMRNRLTTLACTASIGPGSTNMITGAALATINRLPVLLLPSDVFATRVVEPGAAGAGGTPPATTSPSTTRSVPCRASSTGSGGPEQLPAALLGAMRVLADPVRDRRGDGLPAAGRPGRGPRLARGAVRQAGLARRPPACPSPPRWPARSSCIRSARRPAASSPAAVSATATPPTRCARSPRPPASRSPRPRPARARCPTTTRSRSAPSAAPGTTAANALAREADVVIGIGTRYSDFTTASRTAFQAADVRFVNVNVAVARRPQARRRDGGRRRPRGARRADRCARGLARRRGVPRARRRAGQGVGRDRRGGVHAAVTARCPPSRR